MQINYRNLQLARESRGLTQQELSASIVGLNQGNLSKMEKGLSPIPESILERIANTLEYPLCFFEKESQPRELTTAFYRKYTSTPQKQLNVLECKTDIVRRAFDELTDAVDIPLFDIPQISVRDGLTPSDIAKRVRLFCGIPKGPVDEIVKLMESHGIVVIFLKDCPEKFSGVSMFTGKRFPIMFINDAHSNDRKRFTIAHELGHIVMHLHDETVYQKDMKDLDKEADLFSSEFCMPKDDCLIDLMRLKYNDLPVLKMYWKISKAAIVYKAKSLNQITESQYKYIMVQLSKSGQRKNEHEQVSIDCPIIMNTIFDLYRNELHYSEDEFSSIVGLYPKDVYSLLLYKPRPKVTFTIVKK